MSSSKTIAKNTLILYTRMFFTMLVALYTSRVVLNTLGVEDYGIYSIVGGVVSMFGFFNSAMAGATQRFLTFAIGEDDLEKLHKTFVSSVNLHFAIGMLFIILAETLGLWFLNYKLNIPSNRLFAANVVFQLSIASLVVSTVQVPYNALIIAREKMSAFAYIGLLEVFLKLVIVFLLPIINFDHLIVYAILYLLVSFLIRITYTLYCTRNFKESHYEFYYDKALYKELLSFSGWTLFGSGSVIAKNQGINVLLNLFFGTVLNAAYGITMQVQSAVALFLINLQMAFRPQITINYANKNFKKYSELIFQSSKFSYFLILLLITPIIFNLDFILKFWLGIPPPFVFVFIVLALVNLLIESISEPLVIANQATGKIKIFQIVEGSLVMLNIPLSYILLILHKNPQEVYYVAITLNVIGLLVRMLLVKKLINLQSFFKNVLLRIIMVSAFVLVFSYYMQKYFDKASTVFSFIGQSFVLCLFVIFIIIAIGIKYSERMTIITLVKKKFSTRK